MSLVVEAHAIASRAAIQTFTNWAEWFPKLERASENGPIARHLHGKWWPACYGSEPIAIFLRDRSSPAALEAIGQCQLASALTCALSRVDAHKESGRPIRLQREIKNSFQAALMPASALEQLLARRTSKLLETQITTNEISKLCVQLLKQQHRVAWANIKILANGWTTSRRMHKEKIDACFFGCWRQGIAEQEDALSHYIHCERLWFLVSIHCWPGASTPITRLGIGLSPEAFTRQAHINAVLTKVYEQVKHTPMLRESARLAATGGNLRSWAQQVSELAKAGAHEYACHKSFATRLRGDRRG